MKNEIAAVSLALGKVQVEIHYLDSLRSEVRELRRNFFTYVDTLPIEIRDCLIRHYKDRQDIAGDTPMLGEYVPFIVGDMLSISKDVQGRASYPWFLLYAHSIVLDDLLDYKVVVDSKSELLASHVLLEKSLSCFIGISSNPLKSLNVYEKYRFQSISAMLAEFRWSNDNIKTVAGIDGSVLIQGRKSALVKYCGHVMMMMENHRGLTDKEDHMLDQLCCAVQLLDDLTDVYTDHDNNQANTLLSLSYKWASDNLSVENHRNLTKEQLLAALFLSNGISTSLELSYDILTTISDRLLNDVSGVRDFIMALRGKCLDSVGRLDRLINDLDLSNQDVKNSLLNDLKSSTSADVTTYSAVSKLTMDQFKTYFKSSPKASN